MDKQQCPNNNCRTCNALTTKGQCTDRNLIYHMSCGMDTCTSKNVGKYDGETYRPLDDRYTEHYRSAKNSSAKSYADKPWAKHYASQHPDCKEPKINVSIVDRATTTNERKIKEARTILKNKSDLNDRSEQSDLQKFLV